MDGKVMGMLDEALRDFARLGVITFVALCSGRAVAQTASDETQTAAAFTLNVAADEVVITFHAIDAHGLPVNDLKLEELKLLDNGKPPAKILSFKLLNDSSIHAGFLMDRSVSMLAELPIDRAISIQYAQSLFRQTTDQALVMDFGKSWKMVQPWTNNPALLLNGIRNVATSESRLAGTAIFDNLYHVCHSEFGRIDQKTSGNFVLLFSDGEDNASALSLREAVDACQRVDTAIYAFRSRSTNFDSTGPQTLATLAAQTGGQVFVEAQSQSEVSDDLRILEGNLRNQYRLIYKPALLRHDGSFHPIVLLGPDRVESINVRSGYYAPVH
jgi:Ca-activated chloride channel family protein